MDMTINHMADTRHHGHGSGSSVYHGEQRTYPTVPYSGWDFHDVTDCHTVDLQVHNYSNPAEVRNCEKDHLADLNLDKPYVQEKIVDAMNHLIALGVGGFYVNSAKYMSPSELDAIFSRLNSLNGSFFAAGSVPFIYHQFKEIPGEAIQSSAYAGIGRVASYKYGPQISSVFRLS